MKLRTPTITLLKHRTFDGLAFQGYLREFQIRIQSRSFAKVWNTHFIIFSFRARDSFPQGFF